MTVCGLATINLSSMTALQQAILFIQMCLGSPVSSLQNIVCMFICVDRWLSRGSLSLSEGENSSQSLSVYWTRGRHYFESDLEYLVEKARKPSSQSEPTLLAPGVPWHIRVRHKLRSLQKVRAWRKGGSKSPTMVNSEMSSNSLDSTQRPRNLKSPKLRVDMIKRIAGDRPKLINPMGWVSDRGEQSSAREAGMMDLQSQKDPNETPVKESIPELPRSLGMIQAENPWGVMMTWAFATLIYHQRIQWHTCYPRKLGNSGWTIWTTGPGN